MPFIANSVPELSAKVLLEAHEPLSSRRPDLPVALERVVARALCKNASERFPSIAEFALELLPFAPHRARQNVERITKVLFAAGLSTSRFKASVPPGPLTSTTESARMSGATIPGHDGGTTRDSRASVVVGTMPDATQANFGQTSGPTRRSRVGLVAALVLGVVGLAAAAAFLIPKRSGVTSDIPPADFAKQPAAKVEPSLKAVESEKVKQPGKPLEAPSAAAPPASGTAPSEADTAEAAGVAAAEVAAIPPPAARTANPRQSVRSHRAQTKAKAKAQAAAQADEPPAAEEFGQFGGRK